jgi:hypothetical protein
MSARAIHAFIAGRRETSGSPVQYILVVKDELGREWEVERSYSEFAELVLKVTRRFVEPLPKMPPRVPMVRVCCGLLDKREARLVEVLDALTSIARRHEDASEIRDFLKLDTSANYAWYPESKALPKTASTPLSIICESSEESTSSSSHAEHSSDTGDSDKFVMVASSPQKEVATWGGASPCKIKGTQPRRKDGLPTLLGRGWFLADYRGRC